MRPLFNVAPAGATAFVLGIISGFPLGAICAKDLYKAGNLSKPEAERLLTFCNNSGPLFIIGTVGAAIYLTEYANNKKMVMLKCFYGSSKMNTKEMKN